ncbi:MAG TPA: 5-oxoprolinase subunit PxpA [Candidatus Dormibacteraeota bacterium]|nr:5-oxoprolinase subunit PxpA [Candidatus Dormibacteraeota bacterium]
MNLNSDLGEGAGSDDAILRCIDSANVGCGVHAGSASITLATVRLCRELGVQVGAHPGYDDRENFGRVEMPIGAQEIEDLIDFQVAAIAAVAPVAYIKAHGALYHRCQGDPDAADALVRVAARHGVGVMGQPGFEIVAAAKRAGVRAYREGFADRRMLADGSLAPRTEPGAVLDAEHAARQAVALARSGHYDTLCIHGDTKGAVEIATAVRKALREAGIETGPLA